MSGKLLCTQLSPLLVNIFPNLDVAPERVTEYNTDSMNTRKMEKDSKQASEALLTGVS